MVYPQISGLRGLGYAHRVPAGPQTDCLTRGTSGKVLYDDQAEGTEALNCEALPGGPLNPKPKTL